MMNALSYIIFYLAPVMGIVAFLIGAAAVIKPDFMSKKFGIAASSEALPYVVSTGIRDVFIGLVIIALFFAEQIQTLSLSILFVSLVALSDFVMVRKHGDRKMSWIHLSGALIAGLYGTFLLVAAN